MDKAREFVFTGAGLWVRLDGHGQAQPVDVLPESDGLTEQFETPALGLVRVHEAVQPPPEGQGIVAIGLRELYDLVAPEVYGAAQQGFQLLHWRRTHRFCGVCGGAMTRKTNGERAMCCIPCKRDVFPRLNPVAITRVTRGDEILLARRATGLTSFYSVIAGFVEAGESLEQTVAREIREEVGIEVRDIRYFASQPWPFPNNLMIGFTAEYAAGELRPDGAEIGEAGWFRRGHLPPIPHPISISRQLIEAYIQ
ncbi:MAG: NAD(+) diphosphatase [Kiritimatiellae bacterium]|nr:NAD(+) diphosphatase [Kiritimatiellia bacterium]